VPKQILTDLSLTQLHGDGLSSCSIDELAHPTLPVLTNAIVTLLELGPLKILSFMSDAMNQGGRPITLGLSLYVDHVDYVKVWYELIPGDR